jgi:hypothetical protein
MHNERKYDDSVSITEYKEFEGRHTSQGPGVGGGRRFSHRFGLSVTAGLTVAEHATAESPGTGGQNLERRAR